MTNVCVRLGTNKMLMAHAQAATVESTDRKQSKRVSTVKQGHIPTSGLLQIIVYNVLLITTVQMAL